MAENVKKKAREEERIVTYVGPAPDGTYVVQHGDGRLERLKDMTDWERVGKTTDEEIEAAIAGDPDWTEFRDFDWSEAALIAPPKKQPISIRIDADVLDFFKQQGAGYQRRINAVLRSFMEQTRKPKRKKRA